MGKAWAVGYAVALALIVALLITVAFASGSQPAKHPAPAPSRTAAASTAQLPATASVRIATGDTGLEVARKLAAAHVVKTSADFYQSLLANPDEIVFYPGTYTLPTNLSDTAALKALADPANRVQLKLVVPEGFTAAQIYARAAKATGLSVSAFAQVAKEPAALGVPKSAPNVEGWLFPATYTFEPDVSAKAVLSAMVTRTKQALADADLADASAERQQEVLTLASIVQKESGSTADDPKVARVFANRLAKKMPLQSDATVSYGAHGSTVVPTSKEYASANPYNTYKRAGLPVGPISSPGDAAIAAALKPAPGPWLYFVTVNLQTGQTVFSTTLAQHEKAVAQFRAWLKAHPNYR